MKSKKGFTLIEVLVVVLIIGVLAGFAIPQYGRAVEKSRVAEAMTAIASVRAAQGVFFVENETYTNDMDSLPIDPAIAPVAGQPEADGARFTYALAGADDDGYTLTVTRVGSAFAGETLTITGPNGDVQGSAGYAGVVGNVAAA